MLVNLEAERGRLQMTKADVARVLGVSAKTYSSYTTEKTPIPSDSLRTLAKLFGCRVDYLLGLSDIRN